QKGSTVEARDFYRFFRGESCFHQQLELALIAKPCNDAAPSRRIDAGHEAPACRDEGPLELHFLAQHRRPQPCRLLMSVPPRGARAQVMRLEAVGEHA